MKINRIVKFLAMGLCLWTCATVAMATTCTPVKGSAKTTTRNVSTSITVGRDLPIGSIVYKTDFYPGATDQILLCEGSSLYYLLRFDVDNASTGMSTGAAGIYAGKVWETSVAGLGVAFRIKGAVLPTTTDSVHRARGSTSPSLCTDKRCLINGWPSSSPDKIDLLLIKTAANVSPGIIDGSRIPWVKAYRDVGDISVLGSSHYFTGSINVVSKTCKTPDIHVPLGSHSPGDITGKGGNTPWVDFGIELNDCPVFYGIKNDAEDLIKNTISYRIDPVGAALDSEKGILMLNNSGPGGIASASGIGVQVGTRAGAPVPLATVLPSGIALDANSGSIVRIPLRARYQQTAASVTPGPANAAAAFTISYQ